MSKRQAPASGNLSLDSAPPFLPLEESMRPRSGTGPGMESSLDDNIAMMESGEESQFDNAANETQESSSLYISISKKNDNDNDNDNESSSATTTKIPKRRNGNNNNNNNNTTTFLAVSPSSSLWKKIKLPDTKQIALMIFGFFFVFILWESFFEEPEDRLIQPDFSDKFLTWVESNPGWGLGAILIVIAVAVVSLVPIGTPLTLGCGYIYRGVYGWKLGLFVSTVVSMAGSTLGAVICFLLGRHLMRDTVKRWVRNYPMFDAIDVAVSEQGLKIMAMLYLTPVLPLGLVSYMCGTTSIDLYSFAVAKIASLPLYLMYTFMGASAHSFIKGGKGVNNDNELDKSVSSEANKLEENQYLIVAGLVLSVVMMTLITRNIKKELMKILDKQKKEKVDGRTTPLLDPEEADEKTIELGLTARRKLNTKTSALK